MPGWWKFFFIEMIWLYLIVNIQQRMNLMLVHIRNRDIE